MLTFKTKQETVGYLNAQAHLDSNNSGTSWFPRGAYYLSHGEYSQPDFVPRRYKNGWGIHKVNHYYAGTLYAPIDGRVESV